MLKVEIGRGSRLRWDVVEKPNNLADLLETKLDLCDAQPGTLFGRMISKRAGTCSACNNSTDLPFGCCGRRQQSGRSAGGGQFRSGSKLV